MTGKDLKIFLLASAVVMGVIITGLATVFVLYQLFHPNAPDKQKLLLDAAASYNKKDYPAAEAEYQKLAAAFPADPAAYLGIGNCRWSLRDLGGAERAYRKSIEAQRDFAPGLVGLANVAISRREYHAAEDFYLRALRVDAANLEAHYGLALAYDNQSNQAGAIEQFNRVIELAPDSKSAQLARNQIAEIEKRQLQKR